MPVSVNMLKITYIRHKEREEAAGRGNLRLHLSLVPFPVG